MGGNLSLTVLEIIVLLMGAVVLGAAIQFIITSTKAFKKMVGEAPGGKISKELAELKTKYNNETERKGREIKELSALLTDLKENNEINVIEAEEMRKDNKILRAELENLRSRFTDDVKSVYIDQLRQAQHTMKDQQEKMNDLLEHIEQTEQKEQNNEALLRKNKELSEQVEMLNGKLKHKEKDSARGQQQEQITTEINSLLDDAYIQFSVLQQKIEKLETQLGSSKKESMDYTEVKESYYKAQQDVQELKRRYASLENSSRDTEASLAETESKLREANFDRQQMQKKISFLEEMNNDLQTVAEANRNLEKQLKRISELESMLNIVSGERDELARRHAGA